MVRQFFLAVLVAFLLAGQTFAVDIELPRDLLNISPEAARMLTGNAEENFGLAEGISTLFHEALSNVKTYVLRGIRSLGMIMGGVVLLGVVEGVGSGVLSRRINLVGALYLTAVTAGDLNTLIGLGRDTVGQVAVLSKTLIPALASATAAAGGITGAAMRHVATIFFSNLLLALIDELLIPLLFLYIAAATANAVLESDALLGVAGMIKKVIGWGLGGALALYTTYLSVSGAVAGAVDAQTVRVAKTAVSAAVPVVGSILSEAAESLLAGAGVLRAMIGVFGMLALVAVCLLPFLRLGAQYLLYQLAVFVAQAAGPKKLAKLLSMFADAFALILAMVAASLIVLLLSVISMLKVVAV